MRQEAPKPIETPARGLLHRKTSLEHFELFRFEPSADLAGWIEHHWMILHDLGDRAPYRQRNLSHPNQHVVINPRGDTGIFGAATGMFEYVLAGTGRVFGSKFSYAVIASLKNVRQARGISQERLAKMAGLSRTAITMIESRQRNPTLFVCHALATALNIPLSKLVRAVETKKQRKSRKRA